MITQAQRIVQDVDKLISSLRPTASKEFKLQIQDYFKRLNTSLYRPNTQNPIHTKDKILKRVAEKADTKTQLQCHETINNIMGSGQIQKKGELLRFFLKFSEMNSAANNSKLFEVQEKITNLNQTQQTTYGMSSNLHNISSVSSNINPNAFIKPRKPLTSEQLQPLRNRGSIEQNISELDIIRQVSYILQNIEATMITHTEQDTYELQPNINVSQTVRKMVHQLCEIGWLYKRIIIMLKHKGSVEKALAIAVQEEINEYYRWLAVIENGVQMGTLTLRTLISWAYEPTHKLKWLLIVLESVHSFSGCAIISIINSFRPHGDHHINLLLNNLLGQMIKPLLHFIHNWVYKGQLTDNQKQFFVEEKQKVNEVMEWFDKFHLVENNIPNILDRESAQMIFNAGKTIYFLKTRCRCNYSIPIPFMDHEKILSQDIYESSNILSVDFKRWLTTVYENLSSTLVNELRHQYNLSSHLDSMKCFYLMGKGDFVQHLVDTLTKNGQLDKPKHQVYELNLDTYITEAMNKCFQDFQMIPFNNGKPEKMEIEGDKNIKSRISQNMNTEKMIMLKGSKLMMNRKSKKDEIDYENSYREKILNRMISKKVQFADNSWDSFNFQYAMDRIQPLNSILTPDLVENYQRIFQFLWKIKRIQHILKSVWLDNTKAYPKTQNNKSFLGFSRVLHRCHILRCNMNHFVSTFFGYLMIAIESAWDRFSKSLQKSRSLDQIIKEHRSLHSELANITFGSQNKKNLRDSLMNVFKSIEQFKTMSTRIETEYKEFFQKMRHYENRKKILARGYLSMQENELEIPSFDQEGYKKRMMEITDIYDKTFKTFYDNLKKEGLDASVLVFRLDFSEYFAMKEIEDREY